MLPWVDVAEELTFGKEAVTSGAMSDIQGATRVARAIVISTVTVTKLVLSFGGQSGEMHQPKHEPGLT
jgi:ATP-dependent Zn protease